MIVAHHGAETGLAVAVATSLSSVPIALAVFRARIGELIDRWRKP